MKHPEALPAEARPLFGALAGFRSFYLGGGTALALQIGHRVSVDFDFFSAKPIPRTMLAQLRQAFPSLAVTPSVNHSGEMTAFVGPSKVTFLTYPFPMLLPLVRIDGVKTLSTKEIAATKAYTVGRRGEFKDYVDLYFVLAEGHATLEEVLRLAEKKYGDQFNGRLFLEQLLYLDDVDELPLKFLKEPITKGAIISRFTHEIQQLRLG